MGNTQCAESCSECECLSLSTYEGRECTRLLQQERQPIIFFAGIVLFYLTLFIQLGFVKVTKDVKNPCDLVDETFKFITNEKDKKNGQVEQEEIIIDESEDKKCCLYFTNSLLVFSITLWLVGIIWNFVENDSENTCNSSMDSDTIWALEASQWISFITLDILLIFVIVRKCFDK